MEGMVALDALAPELAVRETLTIEVEVEGDSTLPRGPFLVREFHCVDPNCDCQRLIVHVVDAGTMEHLATISHAFRPPEQDAWNSSRAGGPIVEEQTFLDPISHQTRHARALLTAFCHLLARDPLHNEMLRKHYAIVKRGVRDRSNPIYMRLQQHRRESRPRPAQTPARVGRNQPCPCGSGVKHKRCCGGTS